MTKRASRTQGMRLDKPALFAHLGYEPHPGQMEVHLSTAPRRIVACGVRWGKTKCAVMETVSALMHPGPASLGWVVAPTSRTRWCRSAIDSPRYSCSTSRGGPSRSLTFGAIRCC